MRQWCCSVMSDSLQPHELYRIYIYIYKIYYILYTLTTVHRILQARILECSRRFSFSNPGIKPRSPTLQMDSLPAEPQGKPKNTGVGSLSLLHQIFLTQESNRGLLHYRWILYQLSYEGNTTKELNNSLTSDLTVRYVPICTSR